MPSTLLFATNSEGRVYTLSTGSLAWREFFYLGLEFKKISAVPHYMWAVGGDRQVYLHVHGLDVPIRVKEVSYENERWIPLDGFSNRLLPTDRYHFSSMDGSVNRAIDKIRLPSMAWQWEGDWKLDCNLDNQPLDHDGWSYAVDFPGKYHPKKIWNSCVRRRKWIRFRRYSALNSWCAVAPLHKDPTEEPFIDISIGGNNIPGAPAGTLLVWAVTAHGRAMFRNGVSTTSPEGLRWVAISTPSSTEISQISIGPSGLVWAVLCNGRVIVRSGVTRDNLTGQSWLEVKPPGNGLKIIQVSVGTNSVWCVTNDNHPWYRRGINGENSGTNEGAAIGSSWVEMFGNVSLVSVAANNQVFAVGSEDRNLYFRSGVSSSDLTGKKWRLIQCPFQLSRTTSTVSFNSRKSGLESPCQKHSSLNSLYKEKINEDTSSLCPSLDNDETSRSAPTINQKHKLWQQKQSSISNSSTSSSQQQVVGGTGCFTETDNTRKVSSFVEQPSTIFVATTQNEQNVSVSMPNKLINTSDTSDEINSRYFETPLKNPRAWSPVRSVGSIVGTEVHPESDSTIFDCDQSRDSGIFAEDEDHNNLSQYWTECDTLWSCCSAGAVLIDPNQLPNWFNDSHSQTDKIELNEKWRIKILNDLKNRLVNNNGENFENYERAVEMTSWTKTGEARAAKPFEPFEDCLLELEWVISSGTELDSGTLTILNPDGVTTKLQFSLSEITCVLCCSEAGSSRLAIHAPRLPKNSSPVKLQFNGDTDLEDWLSHLTSVCCQINDLNGRPSINSVWFTSNIGDVLNYDPENLKKIQFNEINQLYRQDIDLSAIDTPYSIDLPNGMPVNSILEINGSIYDDADQIRFDLVGHSTLRIRHKIEKLRQVLVHLNPRFNEKVMVFNSMEDSEWKDEIRLDKMVFSAGSQFKLVIHSEAYGYRIVIDDQEFYTFKHRSGPEAINGLYISGRIKLFKVVYNSPSVIVPLQDVFLRQMGGHLRKVETCKAGVTWGIGYDNTVWVYTGGWGGIFLKGLGISSTGINQMSDSNVYYIYENQRWNPLSGYTSTGLPTDRHMWSDITGKQKRSKEHTKLISIHWQWISDWVVDFHTPGGVDRDGWQYAVDFPSTYHGKKQFTDYVRRRRWYRKCRLTTSGPWHELGNSKLYDVSLQSIIPPQSSADNDTIESIDNDDENTMITVWGIATNGDALIRRNVTKVTPFGTNWDHVVSEQPLISISCGESNQIWAIDKNGVAMIRIGVTSDNVEGDAWKIIDTPNGVHVKQISVGKTGIWALDSNGQLIVRCDISKIEPIGKSWHILQNIPNDPPHSEGKIGFKSISVGDEIWAISNSGFICKRCGVTKTNPIGTGWNFGIQGNFQNVSVKGLQLD